VTTLLETVRVRQGIAPLWALHRARLARSAAALGLVVPPSLEAPTGGADRVVRLALGAEGLAVASRDVGSTAPVRLQVVRVPHPGYRHKTTDRAIFDAARAEAQAAGADDALLLAPDGTVAETAIWALGWWEPDGLHFPALAIGVLPSVGRARLTELGPVHDGALTPSALARRAVLVVNAVRGVVPVQNLSGEELPADPRTEALQARFWPVPGEGFGSGGS